MQALDDGDELARAWEVVRDVGQQLDVARLLERDACQELTAARRELAREQRQWGWLEVENARLRTDVDRLRAEAAELTTEIASVRAELGRVLSSTTRQVAPQSMGLPRAERRRLDREQRKRRDR